MRNLEIRIARDQKKLLYNSFRSIISSYLTHFIKNTGTYIYGNRRTFSVICKDIVILSVLSVKTLLNVEFRRIFNIFIFLCAKVEEVFTEYINY